MTTARAEAEKSVTIRVTLRAPAGAYDTGKTVPASVQRQSDLKWWTGSVWQVAFTTFNLTELTGAAGLTGRYEGDLGVQAPDRFLYRIEFQLTGDSVVSVWDGEIDSHAMPSVQRAALEVMYEGVVAASPTPTDTVFGSDVSKGDDRLIGRTCVFRDGTLTGREAEVEDYANTDGVFTVKQMPVAPAAGDKFVVV